MPSHKCSESTGEEGLQFSFTQQNAECYDSGIEKVLKKFEGGHLNQTEGYRSLREEMVIELNFEEWLGAGQREMGEMVCRQRAGPFDDMKYERDGMRNCT